MVTLSPSCESRAKYTTRMMYPVGVYRSLLRMLVLAALLSALVASDSVARQVPPGEQGTLDATVQMVYDLLRGTDEDRAEGEALLQHVLDGHPTHTRAREVDIWRRYRFGGSFMPVVRHEMRERAARQLLRDDSLNAGAHLVLGLLELDLFRQSHNRVQLPSRLSEGNRIDSWLGFVDVAVERSDKDTLVSLFDGEFLNARARLVRDDDVSGRHAERARGHLETAISDAFWASEAGDGLAELAVRTRDGALLEFVATQLERHANTARAHELWTLHHIMGGRTEEALRSHDAARRSMKASRLRQVEDLRTVAAPSMMAADSVDQDWMDKDPLWMTEGNERAAEHMARVVVVELLFGSYLSPERALFSDPGQLVLRYGIPSETVRFSSDQDGFLLLNYPDQYYLFHDMAKAGTWIFYSSSAAALTGPRSVTPQWERDFALRAQEAFENQPDIGRIPDKDRVDMNTAWYVFSDGKGAPGRDGLTAVAAWCAPESLRSENVRMGMYAVERNGQQVVLRKEWSGSPGTGDGSEHCRTNTRQVRLPAGRWRMSLEAVATSTYTVSRHEAVVSTMSSIVPARLIVERDPESAPPDGFFERGDLWIEPLVPAAVPSNEPVSVYAEVNGIPEDVESVSIEAVLGPRSGDEGRRWFGRGRKEAVSVRFEQDVTGSWAAVRLVLDVSNVDPGAYDLVVRVTGGHGNFFTTENRAMLVVLEDADG